MSTALLVLALWVTVPLAVLVVGAWWIEHRDAEQGPPPTRRPQDAASLPLGLDDGLDEYRAAWERHCAEALAVARDDFALWLAEMNGDRRRA